MYAVRGSADDTIEVTFTVSPAVRKTRFHGGWRAARRSSAIDLGPDFMRLFFSPSVKMSAAMREWATQNMRDAHAVGTDPLVVERDLDAGHQWAVLAPSFHALGEIALDEAAPSELTVQIMDGYVVPERAVVRPGKVTLTLQNRTDERELLVAIARFDIDEPPAEGAPSKRGREVEEAEESWMEWRPFLSGKKILTTQSFRDLFRTETLAPDASLELQSLAILFSDLKASTALYERIGDMRALELVRGHFGVLREVIDAEEGAIVKTIGDAVMATFVDPRQAVRAGARMHGALAKLGRPDELALKVGVHTGACVAIDSNERLDYFGQTVNIAARVQGLADGRELVLTETVYRSPGVGEALAQMSVGVRREVAALKGIDAPVVVYRGTVP